MPTPPRRAERIDIFGDLVRTRIRDAAIASVAEQERPGRRCYTCRGPVAPDADRCDECRALDGPAHLPALGADLRCARCGCYRRYPERRMRLCNCWCSTCNEHLPPLGRFECDVCKSRPVCPICGRDLVGHGCPPCNAVFADAPADAPAGPSADTR